MLGGYIFINNIYLIIGSWDKDIKVFDINNGIIIKTFKTHNDYVVGIKAIKDKNNNQNHELSTDYLNQRRLINEKNRERKRNLGELSNLDYSKTNDIRKLIKENGLDENMLKMAKSKLEILDEKKKQKALLLKLNGGIANKPDLGEEICDLMIDSIQARLSIIQEIENLDGNDNIPILNDEQTEDQNKK